VADRHAPPITRKVRSEYAPWITSEIKNLMHRRDFLKRKAVKTGSKQFHTDAFAKERNELNKLIKRTKAEYFTNTLNKCENKPKQMWKTINKLTEQKFKLLLQKLSMKTKVLQMLHLYQIPLILTSTKLE
jgi:DNA-binding LytR/AlgR family response regulator